MELTEDAGAAIQGDGLAVDDRGARGAGISAVRARRLVFCASALYAAVFLAAAVVGFETYETARMDLGNMAQAVWSTAHGHFLEMTSLTGRQTMRFAAHVDPMLALFAPLWWIWGSPLMLLAAQALAVSSGALPVFWLARKHLRSQRAAVHFALAYLLFPATQFNTFTYSSGFHAVSLAIPLILFAVWFLDEERLVPFAACALLAATTKEELPLAVGCLGLWYAVRKGRRLTGLTIFSLGTGLTLFNFLVLIPHYSPSGISPFAGRYEQVGGTPGGILHKAITDPVALLHATATTHKLLYVLLLLGPFLALWLFEPLLFLGAGVDLVINLLSSKSEQTSIAFHYAAGIVPFVVAASVLGAARLKRDPDALSLYALVGAACIAVYSPLVAVRGDVREIWSAERAAKAQALSLVPAGVPVSASNQLAAHLSTRRSIYIFPYVRDARWAVVDANDETIGDVDGYRRRIRAIDSDPSWKVVFASHGVQVLRKREGAPS